MSKAKDLLNFIGKTNEEEFKGFEVGDICTHPTFGTCKVTMFDKPRGLIQVKWPENSSSQANFSLVEPGTLKKSNSEAKISEDQGSKKIKAFFDWANSAEVDKAGAVDSAMEVAMDIPSFEIGHMSKDDYYEIFKLGKKPQSEIFIDGDVIYVVEDVQAMASKLQKVAMKYKLAIPRF